MSSTEKTDSSELQDSENPLDLRPEHEQRIRERAYHLWESDGRPEGRDDDYWERARELDAIASNPGVGQRPITEPNTMDEAVLQDNLGEFSGRGADQGERRVTPMTKKQARSARAN